MENLIILKDTLNNNETLIKKIVSISKETFAQNDELITICIGLVTELREIVSTCDKNIYILNKKLYELITPIMEYGNNLFTHYKIVNAYKLYDFINIDLQELKNFLNNLGE